MSRCCAPILFTCGTCCRYHISGCSVNTVLYFLRLSKFQLFLVVGYVCMYVYELMCAHTHAVQGLNFLVLMLKHNLIARVNCIALQCSPACVWCSQEWSVLPGSQTTELLGTAGEMQESKGVQAITQEGEEQTCKVGSVTNELSPRVLNMCLFVYFLPPADTHHNPFPPMYHSRLSSLIQRPYLFCLYYLVLCARQYLTKPESCYPSR